MRYRKLDSNNDYTLGTGSDWLVNSAVAVAQAIQTRLNLFQGEFFLDTDAGMPWATGVLGKYTLPGADALIKANVLETTGVLAITSYSSGYDGATRAFTLALSVESIYGPVSLETTL